MKTANISVEYIQHVGDDLTVANAARVSFDKKSEYEYCSTEHYEKFEDMLKQGWQDITEENDYLYKAKRLSDKDARLIKYLAKHKHFSPFNHSFITLRIKAPVFVARQLVKHKFMPWNEVSRRYVDEDPEFYFPGNGNWRKKADNVKQGSGEIGATLLPLYKGQEDLWGNVDNAFDPDLHVSLTTQHCFDMYRDLLKSGVCAEQARMVLPQNMMTSWYWSGTLGAYCDMLRLRLDPHTQKESREVAQKVREIIEPLFPVSVPALLENNN